MRKKLIKLFNSKSQEKIVTKHIFLIKKKAEL